MRAEVPIIAANVSAEREKAPLLAFPSFSIRSAPPSSTPSRRAFLAADRLVALPLPREVLSDEVNALNDTMFRSMKGLSVNTFETAVRPLHALKFVGIDVIRRNKCVLVNCMREYRIICENMNVFDACLN